MCFNRYLHDLCERKLRGFPTSIEEDEEALRLLGRGKSEESSDATLESRAGSLKEREEEAEDEDGSREGHQLVLAVQWRLCQKRVLRKAMRTCRLYQSHLSERPELYPQ